MNLPTWSFSPFQHFGMERNFGSAQRLQPAAGLCTGSPSKPTPPCPTNSPSLLCPDIHQGVCLPLQAPNKGLPSADWKSNLLPEKRRHPAQGGSCCCCSQDRRGKQQLGVLGQEALGPWGKETRRPCTSKGPLPVPPSQIYRIYAIPT